MSESLVDVFSSVIALCSLWALGSLVDRVDEMLWVVVLSEGFIGVTEFMFFFASAVLQCVSTRLRSVLRQLALCCVGLLLL